jgi:hypothetical protein
VSLLTRVRTTVLDDTSPHLNHAESRLASHLAWTLVRDVTMIALRSRLSHVNDRLRHVMNCLHANGPTVTGENNLRAIATYLDKTNVLAVTNALDKSTVLETIVRAENNVTAAMNEDKALHCDCATVRLCDCATVRLCDCATVRMIDCRYNIYLYMEPINT